MQYIVLGIAFLATLGIILFLFKKLTPDNTPQNLSGFFFGILKLAIGIIIAVYAALFAVQIIFG